MPALKQTNDPVMIHHRKILLRTCEHMAGGLSERVRLMQRDELRHHRVRDRHARQRRTRLRRAHFTGSTHPHEQRDEEQHRIAEQPDERENERQALAQPRGDVRGLHVVEPHGQQRTEHAPAIHRERRAAG